MSITLSIPPAIVQEVREWAEENGTSLNQYIRECLEAKCAEIHDARKRLAQDFLDYCKSLPPVKTPPGWKFNRERDGHREIKLSFS